MEYFVFDDITGPSCPSLDFAPNLPIQNANENNNSIVSLGYDCANSPFMVPTQAKWSHPIIDRKKAVGILKRVNSGIAEQLTFQSEASSCEETLYEFNKKIGVNIKVPYFSGGVEAEFGAAFKTTSKKFVCRYYSQIYYGADYIEGKITKEYFTNDFQKAMLEGEDIEQIFSDFGTHLVTKTLLGGRIDLSIVTTMKEVEKEEKEKLELKTSVADILSASASQESKRKACKKLSNSSTYLRAIGGEGFRVDSLESFIAGGNKWYDSLKVPNYQTACGISDIKTGMIPIWDLMPGLSDKRKRLFIDAFYRRLAQRQRVIMHQPTYAPPLHIATGKSPSDALADIKAGGLVISANLRYGDPSAPYIYLECADMRKPAPPGNLLAITCDKPEAPKDIVSSLKIGAGFVLSGGPITKYETNKKLQYVYLAWINESARPSVEVDEIDILVGNEDIPAGWEYVMHVNSQERLNCNRGNLNLAPVYLIIKRGKAYRH